MHSTMFYEIRNQRIMRMCLINGMECVLLLAVRGKDGVRQIGYQRKVQVKPSGTRRGPSKGHPPGSPRL